MARGPAEPEGVPPAYVMRPFDVKLAYLGAAWCTVPFELGHDEIGDADDPDFVVPSEASSILGAMGFPPLDPAPLMALHHQIAQKLHGVTGPGSSRAHDLVDLQLIVAMGDVDWARTRASCERLFAYRKMQEWPPTVICNDGWRTLHSEAARDLEVLQDVDGAVTWANGLIERIAAS